MAEEKTAPQYEYAIIRGSIPDVESQVETHMHNGWMCQGGISAVEYQTGTYAQAMIRRVSPMMLQKDGQS